MALGAALYPRCFDSCLNRCLDIVLTNCTKFPFGILLQIFTKSQNLLILSLENKSTVSGTGAISQELERDFGMPHTEVMGRVPFDIQSNQFSLKKAREHVEFLRIMKDHENEMKKFLKLLNETQKELQGATPSAENKEVYQ